MWNQVLNKMNHQTTPLLAIQCWQKEPKSIQLVSSGINLVYRFESHGQGYYLRLTHQNLRSEEELQAAIDFQKHLFGSKVPVCEPLRSSQGNWIESIVQEDEIFLAHVTCEVPGHPIRFNYLNHKLYYQWGVNLGQLHKASLAFKPNALCYTSWKKSLDELQGYVDHEDKVVQDLLQEVTAYFNRRQQTSNNYGLTHGDHREGNVLTEGQSIHIIDFDLPSYNWFTEDVIRPFFHPIIHDEKEWFDKLNPYLQGYLSIMPKQSIDFSAFPWQIKMKCLEIYLWTKNNWDNEEAPGGGNTKAWLNRIYHKMLETSWINRLNKAMTS